MHICVYVCMYISCTYVYTGCINESISVVCIYIYICIYTYIYIYVYICMYGLASLLGVKCEARLLHDAMLVSFKTNDLWVSVNRFCSVILSTFGVQV